MAQADRLAVPVMPGMREDVSEHIAPPGTIRYAKNVRFPVVGEVQARRGTVALPAATSADVAYSSSLASGPDFLAPCPGGFLFGAQGFGYRYDLAQGRVHAAGSYANAIPEGRIATIAREGAEVTSDESVPLSMSVAVGGGYVVSCWSPGLGASSVSRAVVVQVCTEDGAAVASLIEATYSMGVVLYDDVADSFMLVLHDGAGTNVDAKRLSVAATGVLVAQTAAVGTLASSVSAFTAVSWPGTGWALACRTAFDEITLRQMTGVTTLDTEVIADGGSAAGPISLYCDTTHLYLGWAEDNGGNCDARARVYSTALALTSGGTVTVRSETVYGTGTVQAPLFGSSVMAGTVFGVVANFTDVSADWDTGGTRLYPFTLTSAGVVTLGADPMLNMWPVSSPFANGMVWCMYRLPFEFAYANNYWRLVLLDYQNDRASTSAATVKLDTPVHALCGDAFADPMGGSYMGARTRMQQYAPQSADGALWFHAQPRLVRSEHDEATGDSYGLVVADVVKFRTGAARQSCALGSETLVAGSPVLLADTGSRGTITGGATDYANQRLGVDLGMVVEPPIANPSQSITLGGLTVAGVYQYRVILEWIDGTGRRWRSRASRVREETMTGTNDTCTFSSADDYSWLRQFGLPSSQVVKHYYRTVNGGSTFYRVTPPQGAPVAESGTAFVDQVADDALEQREILYTDGGVLDNDHPPSCRYIRATEDRVWCAGLWDAKQAQSSKILVPGEPPQFSDSPAFRVVCPDDITGLAIQDGAVVLFARGAIYFAQGSGPTDQGQGGWDSPRCITRSTGCINALSILETSAGIFFQSSRGLELLPRGLGEPQFTGAAVQDTFFSAGSGSGTVTSAAVITSSESRTARFCMGGTDVLVFDLDTGAWSLDRYPFNVTNICDTDDGAVLALETVTADGFAFLLETEAATRDAQGAVGVTAIDSDLQWVGLRAFSIAGWGSYKTAVGMFDSMGVGYQAANCTLVVDVDDVGDPGVAFLMTSLGSPGYREHTPKSQTGTALKLRLTTAAGGWRFAGWTVGIGDLGGTRRTGSTERG
jgi:hypothetical protein